MVDNALLKKVINKRELVLIQIHKLFADIGCNLEDLSGMIIDRDGW